mgnify:CR=1 FL=1
MERNPKAIGEKELSQSLRNLLRAGNLRRRFFMLITANMSQSLRNLLRAGNEEI